MKDRVIGRIPLLVGSSLEDAKVRRDRVHLKIRGVGGASHELVADHVIAATGYKLDLRRYDFLGTEIYNGLKSVDNTPVLSSSMESSVPGLYFVGAIAANSFGPVMRFAFGARFAANRLARALALQGIRPG
jgi:thioredoxin reductase